MDGASHTPEARERNCEKTGSAAERPGQPDHAPQIITPAEAALRLRVTAEQVRSLIRKGRIYAIDVGTGKKRPLYRITEQAFDDFLARRSKPRRLRRRNSSSMRRLPVQDHFPDLR
jgi:excisionase family DNA binding protein